MRIGRATRVEQGGEVRVEALVRFEDVDRPARRVFVATSDLGPEDLEPGPETFLAAALPAAAWAGERRVEVEGEVCARQRDNLEEALRIWTGWYPRVSRPVLEATGGFRDTRPRATRRTGALVSGGIDSLAALKANRDAYPPDHPEAVQDGLFLVGINTYDLASGPSGDRLRPDRARFYDAHVARIRRLGAAVGFHTIVLRTNARLLYEDWQSFCDVGCGATLAAPALMLGRRITHLLLGSTGYGGDVPPHGTHPAVDPLLSTGAVRVHHDQALVDRLEKTRIVASWPEGLAALQVCLGVETPDPDVPNCGRCQKCVRTMLALLLLGRLQDAPTFPVHEVTVDMVRAITIDQTIYAPLFAPLVSRLAAVGRGDLARALDRKLRRLRTRNSPRRRASRALRRLLPWRR